jgi:hypothetical protein
MKSDRLLLLIGALALYVIYMQLMGMRRMTSSQGASATSWREPSLSLLDGAHAPAKGTGIAQIEALPYR